MKKIIFYLLVVVCFSCGKSSVYTGYVLDENQEAISDVKVQIVGSDIVTYTDDRGFFEIDHKNRGKEILIIKSGYDMQFHTPKSPSEDIKLILKAKNNE